MGRSLGMIEFRTVSTGIHATDRVLKTANLTLIQGQVVCPGKYIALFEGELSAIVAGVEVAKSVYSENLIGTFVLGNPHESIFPAMYGTTQVNKIKALGVFETYDASTCIVAVDVAVKTAQVELIEVRIAKGMCGKSYFTITGDISSVDAAIESAKATALDKGMYLDSTVIANADNQLTATILGNL